MKKFSASLAVLSLVLVLAGSALAGPGGHMGAGRARGYAATPAPVGVLTPAQIQQLEAARAKFLRETLPIRQKLAAKNLELRTLWLQPTASAAKLKAVADEVVELKAQLAKKRNAMLASLPPELRPYTVGWGRGLGRGYRAMGRGFAGRGFGGMMMGPGMRGGPGMMMGPGAGLCPWGMMGGY